MTRVEQWKVVHVIFNRQQWRADRGWYPYTGLSPHTDHLHTEVGESFSGSQTPRCAGGSAGYSGDSPELKAFLVYLGGPHYMDPFPRLRTEAGALTAFNLGSFYCRRVAGSTSWSNHAYGTAIDIGIKSIADGEKVKAWLFADEGGSFLAALTDAQQKEIYDAVVGGSLKNELNFDRGVRKAAQNVFLGKAWAEPTEGNELAGFKYAMKILAP